MVILSKELFEIEKSFYPLLELENYEQAINLIEEAQKKYPEFHFKTYYWLSYIQMKLINRDLALEYLQEAIRNGAWWHPEILNKNFNTLSEIPDFNELTKINFLRYQEAQSKMRPSVYIKKPVKSNMKQKNPLLYSIHWRAGNAENFSYYWETEKTKNSVISVFPQSSQACGINDFCWDDKRNATLELTKMYKEAISDEEIDRNNVIIAGASQGGLLALELALSNKISCKGFIVVVPAIYDLAVFKSLISQPTIDQQVKGYFITGDKDIFYAQTMQAYQLLKENGFNVKVEVNQGVGHRFPDLFHHTLDRAISFILD